MKEHAKAVRASMPVTVVDVILGAEWAGGELIHLESDFSRPGAEDCCVNYVWVKPFVEKFTSTVPSAFYLWGYICGTRFLAEQEAALAKGP